MKKKLLTVLAAAMGCMIMAGSITTVRAAGTDEVFNAEYYALANPDVAEAIGGVEM